MEQTKNTLTLAYRVKLYPSRVKADMLGMLCDMFQREHRTALDRIDGWVENEGRLILKGKSQAGEGEFKQRIRYRAATDYSRCKKAHATKAEPIIAARKTAWRYAEKLHRQKRKQSTKQAEKLSALLEQASRAMPRFKLPYLKAELCDAAEVQEPRKATSFDLWVHVEGLRRDCQLYIPARKHRALNRTLERPGARLGQSAQVMRKNGNWYAIVYVKCPLPEVQEPQKWIGVDVGLRTSVARSDGYRGPDLRPILDKQEARTAERQKQNHPADFGRQTPQKQAIAIEAKKLVSVALASRCGIAIEDPKRLPRYKQWAGRELAKRLAVLAPLDGVSVALIAPPFTSQTCPQCGSVEKYQRHRELFRCWQCGYTHNADFVGSRNIRRRASLLRSAKNG